MYYFEDIKYLYITPVCNKNNVIMKDIEIL